MSSKLHIITSNPNSINFFEANSLPVAYKFKITLIQYFFSLVVTILFINLTIIGWFNIFVVIAKSL